MRGVQWRLSEVMVFSVSRGRWMCRRFGFRIGGIEAIQLGGANYEIHEFSTNMMFVFSMPSGRANVMPYAAIFQSRARVIVVCGLHVVFSWQRRALRALARKQC